MTIAPSLQAEPPSATPRSVSDAPAARLRLDFVDGLRALAALYIVVGHAFAGVQHTDPGIPVPPWLVKAMLYTESGRFAVCLFIVISGFCLMLPVARSQREGTLPTTLATYLFRRCRRILPPYFASILVSLLVLWTCVHFLLPPFSVAAQEYRSSLTPGPILSHLAMVQNWSPAWAFKVNPPTWTVATEFQIYFLFPLLLLPAWRWFGFAGALLAACLVGWMIPQSAEPYGAWYPALFVLGMGAAVAGYFPPSTSWRGERAQALAKLLPLVPWGSLAVLSFALLTIAKNEWIGWLYRNGWLRPDALAGIAAVAVLMYCKVRIDRAARGEAVPAPLRVLESGPLVRLGYMSYSLYLIHSPVLVLMHGLILPFHLPPLVQLAYMWGIAVPASVLMAVLFYRLAERPFLNTAPARITAAYNPEPGTGRRG